MKLTLTFFDLYFTPFRKKWPLLFIGVLFITFVLYIGYQKGIVHPIMRDFYGFWKAGWDFLHGNPLYEKIGRAPQYYYPPFAAMVFVLLSLLPYGVSSFMLYIINVALLPVISELIIRICLVLGYKIEKLRWPLILSIILSFRFYWATLDLHQVNAIVFCICLIGILALLKKRYYLSGGMFILASFFKVIPAIFILWLLFRKCNFKLFAFITGMVIILLLFPILFRGMDQGFSDIHDFFRLMIYEIHHTLENYAYINQNLSASLMRLLTETSDKGNIYLPNMHLSFQTAGMIVRAISILFFGYFLWLMGRIIKFYKNPTLIEISMVFLAAQLFAVYTWKAHMVSMAFVYIPIFLRNFKEARNLEKLFLIILYLLIFICAFSGRALLQNQLHVLIASINIFFYVIFGLFVYYAVLAERNMKKFQT